MSIFDDIQRADMERRETRYSFQDVDDAISECIERMDREFQQMMKDKIVLDPKLDPDPFGAHGIPLADRLRAMGWP